jgi:hypothetical protein
VKWSYLDISVSAFDYNGLVRYLSDIMWYLPLSFFPLARKLVTEIFFTSDWHYRYYLISSIVFNHLVLVLHNSRNLSIEKLGDLLLRMRKDSHGDS